MEEVVETQYQVPRLFSAVVERQTRPLEALRRLEVALSL